jgi:hypothetical protein
MAATQGKEDKYFCKNGINTGIFFECFKYSRDLIYYFSELVKDAVNPA